MATKIPIVHWSRNRSKVNSRIIWSKHFSCPHLLLQGYFWAAIGVIIDFLHLSFLIKTHLKAVKYPGMEQNDQIEIKRL